MPDVATTAIRKAKRGDRVYIDVMQNARAHHVVPPYSLRAVPEATVSVPLSWAELAKLESPDVFTIATVRKRLKRPQPWTVEDLFPARPKRALRGKRAAATRKRRS